MSPSSTASRDAKGSLGRDYKYSFPGLDWSFSFSREQKEALLTSCSPTVSTIQQKTLLSLVDKRLIAAIREKKPPSRSPGLASLNGRIIQAVTHKERYISYPVEGFMVTRPLLDFCQQFFFSLPQPEDREVHNYLMNKIVDLTFCSPEVVPCPQFLEKFCYEVAQKVDDYKNDRIRKISKQMTQLEIGHRSRTTGEVRQEIQLVRKTTRSIWEKLSSSDERPLLCERDLSFVKRALLLTEKQQYQELHHARALLASKTGKGELPHILALADLHLQKASTEQDKQTAVQAAGFYNYALQLQDEGVHVNRETLLQKLHETGKQLFRLCAPGQTASYMSPKPFYDNLRENRTLLKKHREAAKALIRQLPSKASAAAVQGVCRTITSTMKGFIHSLITQCVEELGPPPCRYAIIGFGSLARKEMTPYSDLECAILVENEHYSSYFNNLAFLLHFKIVNLGETILFCLNIPCLQKVGFQMGVLPQGFSLDGEGRINHAGIPTKGCKTPFGNRHTFYLIHTPQNLAAFQGRDAQERYWVEKEKHLPLELITHTLIIGEPTLVEQYKTALDKQLARPYKKGTMRSYLAKEHLYEGDKDRFDPDLNNQTKEGQLIETKKDLYRLPQLLMARLALLFDLRSQNTLGRIEELQKREIIPPKAAENLKSLVVSTMKMRLETDQFYHRQKGRLNVIAHHLGFQQKEGEFILGDVQLLQLQTIYQVLVPFHRAVDSFFQGKSSLTTASFWDETPFTLGQIAARLLRYDKAEEYYSRAKKAEPKNPEVLNALGALLTILGKGKLAIENLKNALDIHKATHGGQHPNVTINLNNLALAYCEAGQLGLALPLFKEALKIDKENRHPTVAIRLNNLATAYCEAGQPGRALPLLQEALEINKASYGEQHPSIATYLNNLATAYQKAGQLGRALPLFKEALEINKENYGGQHPNVARDLNNLALAYKEAGQLKRALPLLQEAIEINKASYGEQHPSVAINLSNLAMTYCEAGQPGRALPLLQEALEINKENYGGQHPNVVRDLNNLALAYLEAGQLKRVLPLVEETFKIINKENYGERHPQFTAILNNLAATYQKAGQLTRALPLFKEALEIDKENYGGQHPTVAIRLNNLAMAYKEAGQLKRALPLLKEALKINKENYGPWHPTVVRNLNNLALAYQEAGQLEKAITLLRKAASIFVIFGKDYGKEHPLRKSVHANLEFCETKRRTESFFFKAGVVFLATFCVYNFIKRYKKKRSKWF